MFNLYFEQVCYKWVCYDLGLFMNGSVMNVVCYEWSVLNRSALNGHHKKCMGIIKKNVFQRVQPPGTHCFIMKNNHRHIV